MPGPEQGHPEPADLEAFGLGRMEASRAAVVAAHVLGCDSCGAALQQTPDDTWVEHFRVAATAVATPFPGAGATVAISEGAPSDAEAPPELVRHPRYRLLKQLGRGGMGVVYQAEHGVMRRLAALKVINHKYTADAAAVERFQREIRAAARLHHPNIVAAYDAERAGETHFLVMEYVEGVSLDRLVAGQGPLPVAEACECVRQAALGLQHAHERDMVHRDVKPANLMRRPDGVVKVLDFGLASVGDGGDDQLTAPNAVMGTPDYIAPEQAEDTHAADARSDIYSLGCTLYFLLTGRPPFARPSAMRTLFAHREDLPEPMSAVRPDAPPELAAVLARMMAKAPAERYPTAAAVAAALAPFAGPIVGQALRDWPTTRGASRPRWRRPLVAVPAAALLACAIGVAALLVHIQTDQGEVTVETDDPAIELVVKKGGKIVRIGDPQSKQTWELDSETYQLGMADQPDGLTIDLAGRQPFVLKRKGEKLVTISRGAAVKPKAMELVRRIPVSAPADLLYHTAVSKGGKYVLVTRDVNPGVRLEVFAVATGKKTFDCDGYQAEFLDDERLVTDGGSMFRVYEAGTGKLLREGKRRDDWSIHAAPGGARLCYFGPTGVFLYDLVEMKELHAWQGKELSQKPRFSPDGKRLLLQFKNEPWAFWDVEKNRASDDFAALVNEKGLLRLLPDGKTAAAWRDDKLVRLDVKTGEAVGAVETGGPDDRLITTYARGLNFTLVRYPECIRLCRAATTREIARFDLPADDRALPRPWKDGGGIQSLSEDEEYAAAITIKSLYVFRLRPESVDSK